MANNTNIALASPLGGMGYAFTASITGIAFTGVLGDITGSLTAVLPIMFLFAGFAQFCVGILELVRGQHALGVCHGSYGIWGMATGALFYTQFMGMAAPPAGAMAAYWFGWALVTLIIATGVWPVSKMFSIVLYWLLVAFVLFAISSWIPVFATIGGWVTLGNGLYCFYVVAAFHINTQWGRPVLFVN